MRGTRAKKRGRPPKASNNDSRYIYSTKLNRVEEEEEEDSNHSSSTTNTSASKYQTRASRKPSYRIGITIERKKTRKRKKGEESEEEDYYVDDEYEEEQAIQSDEDHNSDDDEASAEDEIDEEEEVEEEESEEDESIKKRLRPAREAAPLFLDDTEIPELNLPPSSEDLLISGKELMRALSVYEILRHFQNTLRLTPFRFEDFCVALLIDEQTYLLSEIHIQLLKALIREDDLVGTQHGPQDVRDSINAYLFLCDHLTWPEVLRIYLSSDLKKNSHIIQNCLDSNYPFSSIQNKLSLLEHLCDEFLNTQSSREFLNNEGVIKHEDNCRVCHKPGDLLCCETCPAVFHLTCLDPPLKQVPTEEWICPICKLNSVNGITDCMSDFEKHGFLSRQEPIGWDRNGRKYWLLSRRLIVEDHKSDENIFYYSSRLQFDELMESLDEENYEKDLCKVLFEMKDDIYRQMAITEKLTKTAKGSGPRRSYLEVVNEELFIKRSAKLENHKDGSTVHNTINDEKYAELESKLAVDDDDTRGGVLTRLKTGSLQPKSISSEPLKNRVNVYNSLNFSFREEDSVITFQENSTTLTRTLRKLLPHNFNQTNLFKLGLEGNYRQYQNIYSLNQYALNKFQHADDRDKKRHLSHKFSLTQASDLKWTSYTNINTALMTTTLHGTKSMLINILRQALLYLETQFTQTFMHPNWQVHRTNWIKAVSMCSEPKEFSLALYILESSMKPVLFNSAWHDTLGFTVLQRSTQLERDELKKKDKKDRRDLNEPVTLDSEGPNTSRYYGAGVGVKLVFGKLKHQIWKQKGEEYRLSGIGGWNWLSSTRIKYPACEKSTVEKELCPDFDSPCTLIDISKALQQRELPLRKHYPKVYKASKLDSLLKARLDMFNTEKKRLPANKKEQKDSFSGFRCYSCCCDPILPNRCYSPLCVFDSQKTNFSDTDDFGDTSEHVELIQVTLVDGVEQFAKKTIPFNSKGQLPPSSRFFNGVYRSILILPAHEMRKLGRNGGLREVTGFSYNCKINNTVWPYGLTPRPYFRTMWLLRTHYFNNLHAAALQLRVFWASIRWDDLATKPPLSGTNTITTENEVQTIEILKRRDLPPFGLRSEYLIRKIIVPIDLPVRQREVSTPNRSGLRERRRPESPQVKGPRMTELWINEEEIELWEIRQFGDKAEKQLLMAKQRANQEEKQRQLEMLRKKNEEQRKLNFDSNKMINGSININPAKSITSRLTSIFQNRGSNKIQISSPITLTSTSQINTTSANPTVTYATIRTASGTFKIPVQQSNNRSTTQQLIIRPGTQIIAGNPNQQTIINSLTNAANRPTTATYIVRSPNIASNRPIIISNSLNGPIVRPINNIQTNIKQSIPLISTSTPQKISTMTTVNAILTSTPAKTIVSLPQSVATSSTTNAVISSVNIASSSTLNQTKNIQCVQVKLNDGRTHLLPITSLTGNNQTLQIAVNPNSSNQPYRILTKPSDNTTAKDGQNKPILLTGNSILTPNTFILSNVNNSKVIVQPTISTVQVNTTPTVVSTSTQNTNKIELSKANPTITKTISVNQKEPILQTKVEDSTQSSSNVLPTPKANNAEEKEFVLTAEITQEIIRKALMEPSLQPEMSQKLMAYQRHHQEQFDSNPTQKSPLKVFAPPNLSSRVSSRSSRYSRGKYDSDDYIIDFPKNERTYHSEEDEVTRVCRSIVKTLLDKLEKEEKRIKNKEINEERKQKRAAILKNKYRQNHIELLRRSIIRRKAKFNRSIKIRVEEEISSKLSQVKRVSPKVNICSTSDNIPVVVPSLTKRKLEEEFVQQSLKISEIKTEPSDSLNHSIEESKPKRARMSVTVSPSVSHTSAKKTSNVSKTSPKGRNKELYCICKRPYDNSLMIACDSCSNWYHPMCVGVAPHMVKEIGDYTCPSCRGRQSTQPLSVNNDSLTLEKRSSLAPNRNNSRRPRNSNSRSRKSKPNRSAVENISSSSHQSDEREMEQDDSLYCVCRKVYDPSQFYICCDRCQDWFHGRCVGVTSAEADSIEDYVCPQCEGDTSINFLNIKDLSELDYSNLLKLHKTVQSHRNAWPFLKPVDKKQVPDYYTIIKEPMDLKKIEGRLNGRAYKKLAEFIYDMNKMFDNCRLYNARTSQYYQCAEILEGFFLSKIRAFRDVGK